MGVRITPPNLIHVAFSLFINLTMCAEKRASRSTDSVVAVTPVSTTNTMLNLSWPNTALAGWIVTRKIFPKSNPAIAIGKISPRSTWPTDQHPVQPRPISLRHRPYGSR
ncbi:hypothetical protein QBC35DRAFT_508349 [Podospora australis]|uniref:Secreted protein n=1 Tax=Podospora australis TaxID=1536484 RepID=A0AAN6WJW7_9PEZI|nr:hypothetical protein QBC35DRAFT_508349 [Podospora australis]